MYTQSTSLKRPSLWVIAALMVVFQSCERCRRTPEGTKTEKERFPIPWNSATIQLGQLQTLNQIINSLIKAAPDLTPEKIKVRRCACDSALVNVTLPANFTIDGSGDPATVHSGNTGASGALDLPTGSVVAINYRLDTFEEREQKLPSKNEYLSRSIKFPSSAGAKTVSIGVFDTGLLDNGTYLPNSEWKFSTQTCSVSGRLATSPQQVGYSFLPELASGIYNDDHQYQHGSRVAYLIARQFEGSTVLPKIVPLKVLDKDNRGDMFGLLCAMETARLNKIQVYNLSLGYYGEPHPLLRIYLKKSLADDPNRYIIVAAGNRPVGDTTPDHSLDSMTPKFYPAALVTEVGSIPEFQRLLVVTTVDRRPVPASVLVSSRQNYSKQYAWGVRADTADRFDLGVSNVSIFGSSFATPILTGRLARLIGEANPNPIVTLSASMTAGASGRQVRQNRYLSSHP